MALDVVINGMARSFPALGTPCPLVRLIAELGLKSDRIALERNGEIVTRGLWSETTVADADRLEIVHFVGGGSELLFVPQRESIRRYIASP